MGAVKRKKKKLLELKNSRSSFTCTYVCCIMCGHTSPTLNMASPYSGHNESQWLCFSTTERVCNFQSEHETQYQAFKAPSYPSTQHCPLTQQPAKPSDSIVIICLLSSFICHFFAALTQKGDHNGSTLALPLVLKRKLFV